MKITDVKTFLVHDEETAQPQLHVREDLYRRGCDGARRGRHQR